MKKGKTALTILIIILVLLLIIAAAGGIFYISKLNRLSFDRKTENVIPQTKPEDKALLQQDGIEAIESSAAPEGDAVEDNDVINVLFIGSDRRLVGTSDLGRGDSCMLCSLNKSTGEVKLISFERGISVSFDVEPYDDILTHTFHWGGAELTTDTIRNYFLLDIAGYAHVDFDTFPQVIDAVGGVDVELTAMEAYALCNGNDWRLNEGTNHLNGAQALAYCRLRSIDSDWHRIERQRNTIQAIMNQVKDMNLVQLNELADTILPLVHTDLTKTQITSILLSAPKFLGAHAEQMTVPYHEPGTPGVYCDFQAEAERLKEFIYD